VAAVEAGVTAGPAANGNRRAAIAMDPDEVRQVLDACRTLHVATVEPDGAPHLVPVYFVVLDDEVTFWTYRTSRKAANLRRDPRLCCMVERGDRSPGRNDLQAVMVHGVARMSADPADVERVGIALHDRYMGPVGPAELEGIRANGHKRLVVSVEAQRVVSWDHAKLG